MALLDNELNAEEAKKQLIRIRDLVEHHRFLEAWELAHQLLEQADSLEGTLAIDVINEAGRARKWLNNDEFAKSLLTEGLERAKDENYRFGEAYSLNYIGSFLRDKNRFEEALEFYRQSLDIWIALEETLWRGNVHNNIAGCLENLGNIQDARRHTKKGLELHRKSNNKRAPLYSLARLAHIEYHAGNFHQAVRYARETVKLAQELNDTLAMIDALIVEGIVLKRQGRIIEAKNLFLECIEMLKEYSGRPPADFLLRWIHYDLAHAHRLLGEHEDARKIYQQLMEEEQQKGGSVTLIAPGGLGQLVLSLGNPIEAVEHLEVAVERSRSAGNRGIYFVEQLVILSTVYVELMQFEWARRLLRDADSAQPESRFTKVFVTYGEGFLAQAERNLRIARNAFEKCLELAYDVGVAEYIIKALFHLASLELIEYKISSSPSHLQQMRHILGDAYTNAKKSHMSVLALEIGILKGLSYSADLEFDAARSVFEECKNDAQKLGMSAKATEIEGFLTETSRYQTRAAKPIVFERSLDAKKINEYITSIRGLLHSLGKAQGVD